MKEDTVHIGTVICEKCGQVFILAPMHRFKKGTKYYCGRTCWNHRKDKTKEETAYENN